MTFSTEFPNDNDSHSDSDCAGDTPTPPNCGHNEQTEIDREESYEDRYPPGMKLGKYEVKGVLGWGGMGVVLKGFDPDLLRTVAIKVLGPHLAPSPTARRRFQREARSAAAITHPNVLTIHAVEQHENTPFIVMEYVAGQSLRDYVAARGPLQAEEVIRFSAQIAQGLAAAHAQGVIHRDVKPGNVMLDEGATRAKLADFGLARATFDNAELTSHDRAVGTPSYMAPEQLRAESIDARADLFSFGCVIYFMLTGRSPFHGRTHGEATFKILEDKPVSLIEIKDRTPRVLRQIVERLLEKNRADRYPSASEVSEELSRFLLEMNQTETDKLPELMATRSLDKVPTTRGNRRKRLWATGVVSMFVLVLVGIGAMWNLGSVHWKEPTRITMTEIRVGNGEDCDYQTIAEAISRAGKGCTITVSGGHTIDESITISGAELDGLRLLGQSARWSSPSGAGLAALEIKDVSDVEIKGFRFKVTNDDERAVKISGVTGDLLFRDCQFIHSAEAPKFSMVWICSDARDVTDATRFQDCEFQAGRERMCASVSDAPQAGSRVEFSRCTFSGPKTHLHLTDECRDLIVSHCVFLGGANAINLSFSRWEADHRLRIFNNTFVDSDYWLGLMNSFRSGSTPQPGTNSQVCNNLILGGQRVMGGDDQWEIVLRSWDFQANWWESGPLTIPDAGRGDRVAAMHESLDLGPRDDPNAPNFLAPAGDSPLATAGIGGDLPSYIGAIPPLAD